MSNRGGSGAGTGQKGESRGDLCVSDYRSIFGSSPEFGGEDETGTDDEVGVGGGTARFLESMFVCRSVFRAIRAFV